MKRILSLLLALICVIGFIYGCAAVSSASGSASEPAPASTESSAESIETPSILLCLPRDGEDHTLLRAAFTEKAQAAGYQALISEPAADNTMTDEQIWDIEQLQYQAQAVIVYNCDGVEEGLIKKWSDAGVTVIAAGKRLDGQMTVENTMLSRRIKANIAYADGALSKAIAAHITDTLSTNRASAGFVALFGDTDAQLEFLNFVKADIQLAGSSYTPNAPAVAADAATALGEVKAAKAILYAGTGTAAWTDALAQTNTSALFGLCSTEPAALTALQADSIDFLTINDPIDLMDKAVSAAHTLLSANQALAEWSSTANTLVLTPDDPRLQTYLSYCQ